MQNPYLYTVFQHIIARDVVRKLIQVIYFLLISTFLSNKNNQVIKVPKLLLTASKSKIKLNTFFPILTHYKYIPMHMVIMYISRSSIIGMTWSKKSSPIIEIPIIEIPIIYYYLKNRNPDNRGTILQMEYFINPGIARITVIEFPIIEVSLYMQSLKSKQDQIVRQSKVITILHIHTCLCCFSTYFQIFNRQYLGIYQSK